MTEYTSEFNYMDGLFTLKLISDIANYEDIHAVEAGAMEFGIVVDFPPAIFFLFNIHDGDLDTPDRFSGDAPYSIHLVPEEKQSLPPPTETIGRLAIFLLTNGEVKAKRAVGLTRTFMDTFRVAAAEQKAARFDERALDATINEVYAKYPSLLLFTLSPVRVVIPKKAG